MKVLVAAFNQEKALVGAFSVIVKTDCESNGSFYSTSHYTYLILGKRSLGKTGPRRPPFIKQFFCLVMASSPVTYILPLALRRVDVGGSIMSYLVW